MSKVRRQILKDYFLTGEQPTQGQFGVLIDSMVNIVEDQSLLGLQLYDSTRVYLVGNTMIYNNAL